MNKKGLEMGFAWMFAIIAGAIIIFLAIYATTRLVDSEREVQDTELGKQIGILLNPIETGIASGKVTSISMQDRAKLFNECNSERGVFGVQKISVAADTGIGEKELPGIASSFMNKYLFSESVVEGKRYIVFAKPLSFPFEVADLMILWSAEESYCFVSPNREIEEEINDLEPGNVVVVDGLDECSVEDKKVCFSIAGCDIDVNLNSKSVRRNNGNDVVYYEEDYEGGYGLLYGAIFSDSEIYECQTKRLMSRASELAALYRAKSEYLSVRGCGSSRLQQDLALYILGTGNLENSLGLRQVGPLARDLGRENDALSCRLF